VKTANGKHNISQHPHHFTEVTSQNGSSLNMIALHNPKYQQLWLADKIFTVLYLLQTTHIQNNTINKWYFNYII
jgi:hypothetical protein